MKNEMFKCSCPNSVSDQPTLAIQCVIALESFLMSILRYAMKITMFFLCHLGESIWDDFEDVIILLKKAWGTSDPNQIKLMPAKNGIESSKLVAKTKCTDKLVPTKSNKLVDKKRLSIGDVREMMSKFLETNLSDEGCDEDDLFNEELSLEEVREAFEVFDGNKDGFIDAEEVQRVLSALGVMEASQSECKGMIKAFDNDGDGKIDFNEFTKLIEESFR